MVTERTETSTPLARDAGDKELHYGHFAKVPSYVEANRAVVAELFEGVPDEFPGLPNNFVCVDVATGTGLVPQLVIEQAKTLDLRGIVVGLDPNKDSLKRAIRETPPNPNVTVHFVEGYGQDADRLVAGLLPLQGADIVTFHDAIHEIEDKKEQEGILAAMWRTAKMGALASVTSAFTSVAMDVGGSLRGYGEWKLHLVRLTRATRDREIQTLPYRTPNEYKQMLAKAGFESVKENIRVVGLPKDALKAIARYPRFIEGFCKDLKFPRIFTLKEISDYMCQAVDLLRSDNLPRNWYELVGRKVARSAPAA